MKKWISESAGMILDYLIKKDVLDEAWKDAHEHHQELKDDIMDIIAVTYATRYAEASNDEPMVDPIADAPDNL